MSGRASQEREFGNAEGLELLRKSLKSIRNAAAASVSSEVSADPDDQVRPKTTNMYFLRFKKVGTLHRHNLR